MIKLRKTFANRPVSAPLVLLALAFSIVAAFTGSTGASAAAISCITGAIIFGGFFDL